MNTPKIIVIHHSADFDGLFCREIARKFLGAAAEYIGYDYGEPVPVIPDSVKWIYLLDISIPELMADPRLVWIDHHKTAIEQFPKTIKGYRLDGVAACRLAWQWFEARATLEDFGTPGFELPAFDDYYNRRLLEPLSVRLAGEHDIWDKRDSRVDLFQHGLLSQPLNWPRLLLTRDDDLVGEWPSTLYVFELVEAGRYVAHASREGQAYLMAQGSFNLPFEGLRFLAINAAVRNSTAFESRVTPEHDACLSFVWSAAKGRWKISLRGVPHKANLDLSPIAKKYGGGGHRQACGFECDALPFNLTAKAA
jgi:uncharacterized protein